MEADFKFDLHTDSLIPDGHHSRLKEPRTATREESLMWARILELESIFESHRPQEARDLLAAIPETDKVLIHPEDFAMLRQYCQDKVKMLTDVQFIQNRILGEISRFRDGNPETTYLLVRREGLKGSPSTVTD